MFEREVQGTLDLQKVNEEQAGGYGTHCPAFIYKYSSQHESCIMRRGY
jgi:hypothetical protein